MDTVLSLDKGIPIESPTSRLDVCHISSYLSFRPGNTYTIVFVVRGAVGVRCAKGKTRLHAHHALLIDPARGQQIELSIGEETEVYMMSFVPAVVQEHGKTLIVPEKVEVYRPLRMTYLLRRYLEQREKELASSPILANLLVLVLREIALSAMTDRWTSGESSGTEALASHVDAYIAAHYREPIGLTDIAAELRYNADYLERVYRQGRALSIREAIRERRIREAGAQLRIHKDRSIADIARMCGFRDTNYFRRVFKHATNLTPNRYRFLPERRDGADVPG